MRILIVEDDAALLESLAEVLASFGYAVATARDGEEALSKVASSDVLLTDVVLPRLSGLDLARRAREAHRELDLIVMTGHHTPAIREEASLAGARAYFQTVRRARAPGRPAGRRDRAELGLPERRRTATGKSSPEREFCDRRSRMSPAGDSERRRNA